MSLTDAQRRELHTAMIAYLEAQPDDRYANTCAAFRREAAAADALPTDAAAVRPDLLERKWTSVVRLTRKVLDLETRLAQMATDLEEARKSSGGYGGGGHAVDPEFLPRKPASSVLEGHRGPVTAVAVHPVYNVIVSCGEDAAIKVWNVESGICERSFSGHTGVVNAVTFDKDGELLASASNDTTVKVWRFGAKGGCMCTLRGHDHTVSGVCFLGADGHVASCSRDETIKVWDPSTGFCLRTLSGHTGWVRALAANADGSVLASGSADTTVRLWHAGTGAAVCVLSGHEHAVESVDVSDSVMDEALTVRKGGAATGAGAGSDAAAGDASRGTADGESAGPGGGFVVSCARDTTVRVWDVASATCIASLASHTAWVRGVVFHPCGRFVLSVSEDRTLRVWDVRKGACIATIEEAHEHFVTCVAVARRRGPTQKLVKNEFIATGGLDKAVRLWTST